jgi:hypothetical protein
MSPSTQLLVVVRYFAAGSFQIVHGDLQGVSQPSACRIVRRISKVISRKTAEIICFPTAHAATENKIL